MQWLSGYLGFVLAALAAILPIVNPLGAVPIVMAAGAHLSESERLRQIRRACVYTFALMAGFAVAGGLIMNVFGISLPGMRIAGGLIVAVLGFNMLFPSAVPDEAAAQRSASEKRDIAFTPLAMPGLSGPGTFAVVMSLASQASASSGVQRVIAYLGLLTGLVLVSGSSYLVLRASDRLHRVLGETGMIALMRLTGFLMICIGVQFIINGLAAVLQDPAFWSGLAAAVRAS